MSRNSCFNIGEVCPDSREYLHHKNVNTVRCGRCGLLNPRHPDPVKPFSSAPIEIIDVDESPVSVPQPPESMNPPPPPAKRRGTEKTQSLQVPGMPDFKLGYAEKERQAANQRVEDRKTKTGFTRPPSVVHLSIMVAHFHWEELGAEEGYWTAAPNQWSIDQSNSDISSQALLDAILKEIRLKNRRGNLGKWLHPDGLGDWSLGHANPTKSTPRDIVTWDDPKLLSEVIDTGSYEQRAIQGTPRKLVSIWLYWTPSKPLTPPPRPRRTPVPSTPPTPTPMLAKRGRGRPRKLSVKPECTQGPAAPDPVRKRPSTAEPTQPTTRQRLMAEDNDPGEGPSNSNLGDTEDGGHFEAGGTE
jgi:hypothetical protein